jgi:hypothetical protein
MVPGAFLLSASELNSYFTDPTIKSYLDKLDLPKTISISLVIFGLITYIAHGHQEDHA